MEEKPLKLTVEMRFDCFPMANRQTIEKRAIAVLRKLADDIENHQVRIDTSDCCGSLLSESGHKTVGRFSVTNCSK